MILATDEISELIFLLNERLGSDICKKEPGYTAFLYPIKTKLEFALAEFDTYV